MAVTLWCEGGAMMIKRYALYFAPAEAGLWQAGSDWLGWDAATGRPTGQPAIAGLAVATAAPRKYGFHATLKAPFRLAEGVTPRDLHTALAALAGQLAPVPLPGLAVTRLGRFLALCPQPQPAALTRLAAEVVTAFEPFRAPLSVAEIARRQPDRLSPRQAELLHAFGYPYVFEEFRFHLSLTGDLAPEALAGFEPLAQAFFAPHLARPVQIDRLCLFGEDEGGRFHLLAAQALSG
ncbi:phosphonate metabolism protein [Rhodobacter capsulatus B6]|nr:phosphonate metabolism protein [Rhodobacter capsulatus B6]